MSLRSSTRASTRAASATGATNAPRRSVAQVSETVRPSTSAQGQRGQRHNDDAEQSASPVKTPSSMYRLVHLAPSSTAGMPATMNAASPPAQGLASARAHQPAARISDTPQATPRMMEDSAQLHSPRSKPSR